MNHFWPHFFFFLMLLTATIVYGICVFAFAAPKLFAKWFSPFYWMTRKMFRNRADRLDKIFAYSMGSLMLILLLGVQFLLGGFFATGLFDLWQSPFALFFTPSF